MRCAWLLALTACRLGFEARFGEGSDSRVDARTVTPPAQRRLFVGTQHACDLRDNGDAYCWGQNSFAQLGTGSMSTSEPTPVRAAGTMAWQALALGSQHSCALDLSGRAWCWGANGNGQLGLATAACGNGTVDSGEECDDANTANGDACSAICTIALPPTVLQPTQLPGNRVYRSIFARTLQTWAIASDGTLWSWGRNGARQLGVGDNADRGKPTQVLIVAPQVGADDQWLAVGGGDDHACAIQVNGSLWCWGSNGNGQLGQGTSTMIVRERPEVVVAGSTWQDVGAGRDFGCALDRTGVLHCWGLNVEAQLGLGDVSDRNVPAPLAGTGWDEVANGLIHACARRSDGTAWCWGRNTVGQSGTGTMTPTQSTPAVVEGVWRELGSGNEFSCGLRDDDSIWCWGDGNAGRLGTGNTISSPVPVRVLVP